MISEDQYAELGLRALKRAAIRAAEIARRHNLKIPIWKNGKVEYITPDIPSDQKDSDGKKPSQT